MTLEVNGRRDPGRPKKNWEQVIASDLRELRYPESGAGQTKLEEDYCDEQSNPCQHGITNYFKLMMMMFSALSCRYQMGGCKHHTEPSRLFSLRCTQIL